MLELLLLLLEERERLRERELALDPFFGAGASSIVVSSSSSSELAAITSHTLVCDFACFLFTDCLASVEAAGPLWNDKCMIDVV